MVNSDIYFWWHHVGWRLIGFPLFWTCWLMFLGSVHHKRSHCGCFCRPGAQGSAYLHLTLWQLSDVCYANRGSLPWSMRQWWEQLKCLHQGSTSSVGMNGLVGVLDSVYQMMPSLSLTSKFFVTFISGGTSLAYNWYISFHNFCFFGASSDSQGF